MRPTTSIIALPTTLILLLCTSPTIYSQQPWPYNLPRHMKYFPEEEAHVKRSLDIQARLRREKPIGVKKMSSDEGEMFFLHNWIFEANKDLGPKEQNSNRIEERSLDPTEDEYLNISALAFSPLRPHEELSLLDASRKDVIAERAAELEQRDFKCPDGTTSCASIGAPNSCCGSSDNCINIPDTGLGPVGCCPQGRTCGGGAISCDTRNGYSSCPNSPNGGCCLPGYSCQDVGCVVAGTSITFVRPSTSSTSTSRTSTAVIVVPTTVTASSTRSSSSLVCSSGWFSCPATLGGGCCRNGAQCASGSTCLEPSSTTGSSAATSVPPSAPVRPTSGSSLSESSISIDPGCPTGFYACKAYYPDGCCRIGRDCQTTSSCVPTSSTTLVNSNGITIVAPTGATLATTGRGQGGSCPSGWFSCAANVGGNCCPNGYSCGQECTITEGGATQVAGKLPPNSTTSFSRASIFAVAVTAMVAGTAAIFL